MVGLLALIGMLVLLIGAVEKCKRKHVEDPAGDIEQHRPSAVPNTTQADLTRQSYVPH